MKNKIKKWLKEYLQRVLWSFYRNEVEERKQKRFKALEEFIHQTIPTNFPEYAGDVIFQNCDCNLFALEPTMELPHFDFILLRLGLYIRLEGPESGSKAQEMGYSLERTAAALEANNQYLEKVPLKETKRTYWNISWDDSTDQVALLRTFKALVK